MSNAISLYAQKLASLRKEISEIHTTLRKNKKSFNRNQQKVYDFIIAKRDIIQFDIQGKQYFIKKGNAERVLCISY